MQGKFIRFSKLNTGDNTVADGDMTVTIAGGGNEADIVAAAGALGVPGGTGLAKMGGQQAAYGTGPDNFLDLGQSGANYSVGTYVTTDANNWYVGTAAGGEITPQDQITANATYTGTARGAIVPIGWTQDIQPYEMTGDATLNLAVAGGAAAVDGAITNVRAPDLIGNQVLSGSIAFQQANVVDGAYSGNATVNLGIPVGAGTVNGTGAYEGAFYGAGAAETAGVFGAEGIINDVGGQAPYKVIGNFGAAK